MMARSVMFLCLGFEVFWVVMFPTNPVAWICLGFVSAMIVVVTIQNRHRRGSPADLIDKELRKL